MPLGGTILTLPAEQRSAGIAHGIVLELVETSGALQITDALRAVPKMLRIAPLRRELQKMAMEFVLADPIRLGLLVVRKIEACRHLLSDARR